MTTATHTHPLVAAAAPAFLGAWMNAALSDFRCVYCVPGRLSWSGGIQDPNRRITCHDCGCGYDLIDGVPFFGTYDEQDFQGLIEIISTSAQTRGGTPPEIARLLNTLLGEYHAAGDQEAFIQQHSNPMVQAVWFANHRYHEWLQTEAILAKIGALEGLCILNVGAGTGADAIRLADLGPLVTCIDYAPTQVADGQRNYPSMRWVGGFSHALPFGNETFDIVCANAALHHMRSVPNALREMLRVLKPGGFIFSTGDPFRSDHSSDDLEFQVFNNHPGVLSGINEGIIRFDDFYSTLQAESLSLDTLLMMDVAPSVPIEDGVPISSAHFHDQWAKPTSANLSALREASGSIGVLAKKVGATAAEPALLSPLGLPAAALSDWLDDEPSAYARLIPWAPTDLFDLPFPGDRQTWFELLSGWMAPSLVSPGRQGYKRARWLLRGGQRTIQLAFHARGATSAGELTVLSNGVSASSHRLTTVLELVSIAIESDETAIGVLIELRWKPDNDDGAFETDVFEVVDRSIIRHP